MPEFAPHSDEFRTLAALRLYDLIGSGFDHRGVGPFEQVLKALSNLLGGERALLVAARRSFDDARAIADTGPDQSRIDLADHVDVLESIVLSGSRGIKSDDGPREAAFVDALGATRVLAAAVRQGGESACILIVCDASDEGPRSPSRAILEGAAGRLGRVLERQAVHTELHGIVERERVMRSMNEAIRASLDPVAVANAAANELGTFFDSTLAAVLFAGSANARPVFAAERTRDGAPRAARLPGESLEALFLWDKLATGRVLVVDDVRVDMRCAHARRLFAELGVECALVVPLLEGEELAGAIGLFRSEGTNRWMPAEIALAEVVGAQTAVGIRQAAIYQRLERSLAESQKTNRLKDEFISTVSHELRTPLVGILGWAEMLAEKETPSALVMREGPKAILQSASILHQLIEDLIDLSRLTRRQITLEVGPLDLNETVREAVKILSAPAEGKELTFDLSLSSEPLTVRADPTRLEQILWVLLANAIKFTYEGGRVTVTSRVSGASAEVSVADTGVGIPEPFLPYVFDRFRQADGSATRSYGGLGIGLSIARALVELHGGTIEAQSEGEGCGSCFTLRLPLCSEPPTIRVTGNLLTEKGAALLRSLQGDQ